MSKITITRKKFFKLSALFITAPFFIIWKNVIYRTKQTNKDNKIILVADIQKGISFNKSLYIFNDKSGLQIYSAKCTHLGCRINKIENDKLICPCHGSEFDLNGKVIKGPATAPLKKLNYTTDTNTKEIIVIDA